MLIKLWTEAIKKHFLLRGTKSSDGWLGNAPINVILVCILSCRSSRSRMTAEGREGGREGVKGGGGFQHI